MLKNKKVIFTGGGTAGHVLPNIAIISQLPNSWKVYYLGSKQGIEGRLVKNLGVSYHEVAVGKLRRYFSFKNLVDPFKVIVGLIQSFWLIVKIKPDLVFSKGGYVALPVTIAAWILQVPVVMHESDLTLGLANRVAARFAAKICIGFPEALQGLRKYTKKTLVTGIPVRSEFISASSEIGRKICGFNSEKPILVVLGGSLGSQKINVELRKLLPKLLDSFQIAHICGEGKVNDNINYFGYQQFAYLDEELPHLLAAADLVISRAGANTLGELVFLQKPSVLMPLGNQASRGDQLINANYFAKHGFSKLLLDSEINSENLYRAILTAFEDKEKMIRELKKLESRDAVKLIIKLISELTK